MPIIIPVKTLKTALKSIFFSMPSDINVKNLTLYQYILESVYSPVDYTYYIDFQAFKK